MNQLTFSLAYKLLPLYLKGVCSTNTPPQIFDRTGWKLMPIASRLYFSRFFELFRVKDLSFHNTQNSSQNPNSTVKPIQRCTGEFDKSVTPLGQIRANLCYYANPGLLGTLSQ